MSFYKVGGEREGEHARWRAVVKRGDGAYDG
jgi:hypothetical protein